MKIERAAWCAIAVSLRFQCPAWTAIKPAAENSRFTEFAAAELYQRVVCWQGQCAEIRIREAPKGLCTPSVSSCLAAQPVSVDVVIWSLLVEVFQSADSR